MKILGEKTSDFTDAGQPARTWASPAVVRSAVFLLLLYSVGVLLWMQFFDFAQFRTKDWHLVAKYHDVLRDAFARGEVPYFMTYKGHYSDRFLALPETPLSPQYLLLPWLNESAFNLLNCLLFYSVGFGGLLLIRKAYGLHAIPFLFIYLLYSFNGYIVSRIGVGQTMWYAYFLLPYFHYFVLRIVQGSASERSNILLILVLFLMLLHGSFLLYTWCLIYLALILIFNPALWRPVLYICVGSIFTGLFRFLPAAVTFGGRKLEFIGGYPSLSHLLDALTTVKDFRETYQCGPHTLGWWELDCYIGLAGLGLILYFGVVRRQGAVGTESPAYFSQLDIPNVIMLILCFGQVYAFAAYRSIPLLSAQRVSARFIIVPVTMLALLVALRIQDFLSRGEGSYAARLLLMLSLGVLAWELYLHLQAWNIYSADRFYWNDDPYGPGPARVLAPAMEDAAVLRYIHAVRLAAVLSCCAIGLFAYRFVRAEPAIQYGHVLRVVSPVVLRRPG